MKIDLQKIKTEGINENTINIDKFSTLEILQIINKEDQKIAGIINKNLNTIAEIIDLIYEKYCLDGRLIYIGAGTSGRLGILDASEMLPTYGVTNNKILGLIAGGIDALINPIEGAEDDEQMAICDLKTINLTSKDSVIGITASGRTPYVLAGLKYAKDVNSLAIGFTMSNNEKIVKIADKTIFIETGPEVITGSTRMKAGTATKMVCNMISTTLMIKVGKIYNNFMIDLKATNEKLKTRAENIVQLVTNCNGKKVKEILKLANYSCRHAIIMILLNCTFQESKNILKQHNNNFREVISQQSK